MPEQFRPSDRLRWQPQTKRSGAHSAPVSKTLIDGRGERPKVALFTLARRAEGGGRPEARWNLHLVPTCTPSPATVSHSEPHVRTGRTLCIRISASYDNIPRTPMGGHKSGAPSTRILIESSGSGGPAPGLIHCAR